MAKKDLPVWIMAFLKKQTTPVTTRMVAEGVGCSWHTAKIHLLQLHGHGKIRFAQIARQNQWWIRGQI